MPSGRIPGGILRRSRRAGDVLPFLPQLQGVFPVENFYAELGFQAPTEVPEEIWAAYMRLAADGYDQHVIP